MQLGGMPVSPAGQPGLVGGEQLGGVPVSPTAHVAGCPDAQVPAWPARQRAELLLGKAAFPADADTPTVTIRDRQRRWPPLVALSRRRIDPATAGEATARTMWLRRTRAPPMADQRPCWSSSRLRCTPSHPDGIS